MTPVKILPLAGLFWLAVCLSACDPPPGPRPQGRTMTDQKNLQASRECVIAFGEEKGVYPESIAEAVSARGDAALLQWVREKDANLVLPLKGRDYTGSASERAIGWRYKGSRKGVYILVAGAADPFEDPFVH